MRGIHDRTLSALESLAIRTEEADFMKRDAVNSRNDGRRQRERRYQLKVFGRRL